MPGRTAADVRALTRRVLELYVGLSTTLDLFADELRRARAAAGLSQEALAHEVNYSASLIAKVELSQRRPGGDFTRRCDTVLGTGGLLERILRTLHQEAVLPWFREWAAIEQEAAALRCYEPMVVPGLLQIEQYARAVLSGGALLDPDEVEQQVIARLDRQRVLTGEPAPHLYAVLHNAWEAIRAEALSHQQSIELVSEVAETWT